MNKTNLTLGEEVDARYVELLARLGCLQTRVRTYVDVYRNMYGEGDPNNPNDKHLRKLLKLLDEAVAESEK
jgi:hypothetical protein